MTEINTVRVYEFRSGFTYQSCGESWRSTGFYGSSYIGITFDHDIIPKLIQRAARREDSRFDVSQKIYYQRFINLPHQDRDSIGFQEFNEIFVDENALVGRIIEGWAVLAVVSVAIDFGNRPFPVKRYFCCRESYDKNYDAMATLIEFFFDNGQKNLTFDILENQPEKSYPVCPLSSQDLQEYFQHCYDSKFDGLYLLKPDLEMSKNNLLKMWKTCLSLVSDDRKKAAWAFNVDSVANLTDFTLIRAGTQEFFNKNYSAVSPQVALTQSNQETIEYGDISNNFDVEFKNFVKNRNLSSQMFALITTGIQQNNQQLQRLANQDGNEIITEFQNFSFLIRYYTLSALIAPERSVDLFQQLLFSEEEIWRAFLSSAKSLKNLIQLTKNDWYFEKYIEEGVWLIINYIIEDKFQLHLDKREKLKRFFTEEDNIWIEGICFSYQKYPLTESSKTTREQENTISSFQDFIHKLEKEEHKRYRKDHEKGYKKITQIFSHSSHNTSDDKKKYFLFFHDLIEEKLKGKIDVKKIFNYFVKDGKLSRQRIEFIKTNVPQNYNYKQWQKLATKNKDEITTEYNSYMIRYYTLSALIVPKKAVDLLQQLLLNQKNSWELFLRSSQELKSLIQPTKNNSYFKDSLEEGVWLIINYIIQDKSQLHPDKREQLKRFFTEEDNIWREGIFSSLKHKGNVNPFLQSLFYKNLNNKKYREQYMQGYQKIDQILEVVSTTHHPEFCLIRALILQKIHGYVVHSFYYKLQKPCQDYPLFRELLVEEKMFYYLEEDKARQRPQLTNSQQQTQKKYENKGKTNKTKRSFKPMTQQIAILLGICAFLSLIAIILEVLQFEAKIFMLFAVLGILLGVIAFLTFTNDRQ